ncbi:Hypothetical protein SRAE_X000049800 [Strongyloides ratti]|uniref:CUB domain-containing protein n=1 Tax=Strongyloides ratti TaxID=34506 RepID=A0A090LN63_STRRB|nr:Hypothetical protein SRAE_X000049800 [Strongyloides ratti]CEF71171.1 Hypothetical protein SRAE_X000049800 [Strongyloides ratti]
MILIGMIIMFLEFIFVINAYDRFRKVHIKDDYSLYWNPLLIQQKPLDNEINYIKECYAFIDKKGIYGTKSSQDNLQNNCIISISTLSFDEDMYIKFMVSNVICKYYPNLYMNLTFPENNKKFKINYCSMEKNTFPIYYKEAILEYEVIGLPIKFKLDFIPFNPVCGSKIQTYQIGQIITLRKPLNFQRPCTLILPGNSVLKILNYNFNINNNVNCIKLYDGRVYNGDIDKKEEICSNNIRKNKEIKKIFDISCSQGELIIDTFYDKFKNVKMYEDNNYNETSVTFIITKLPETDFSLVNSFIC